MMNNTYFPSIDSRSDRIGGTSYESQHLYSLDRGKMISMTLKPVWYTKKFHNSQGYVGKHGERGGGERERGKERETEMKTETDKSC